MEPRVLLADRIQARWWARRADRTGTTVPDPETNPQLAALWRRQLVADVGMVLDELAAIAADDELLDLIGAGVTALHADRLTRMLAAWRAETRTGEDRPA